MIRFKCGSVIAHWDANPLLSWATVPFVFAIYRWCSTDSKFLISLTSFTLKPESNSKEVAIKPVNEKSIAILCEKFSWFSVQSEYRKPLYIQISTRNISSVGSVVKKKKVHGAMKKKTAVRFANPSYHFFLAISCARVVHTGWVKYGLFGKWCKKCNFLHSILFYRPHNIELIVIVELTLNFALHEFISSKLKSKYVITSSMSIISSPWYCIIDSESPSIISVSVEIASSSIFSEQRNSSNFLI